MRAGSIGLVEWAPLGGNVTVLALNDSPRLNQARSVLNWSVTERSLHGRTGCHGLKLHNPLPIVSQNSQPTLVLSD